MKKRFFSMITVFMVFSILLSACSSGTSKPADKPKEKVEIRFSTWAGADEAKELQAILDKLNAKSETYKITQDSNPADYDTRITTQLTGSNGPDLFWVSAQRAAQFAAKGALLDITSKLPSSKNPAANVSDYFEASLDPFKKSGKIYGLPWLMQPIVIYANKDMFDKAGVLLPDSTWNWDKFMEAAKKITTDQNGKHPGESGFDAANVKQWGATVNGWPPVQMFVWQGGGDVIAADFSNSPIDKPEAIAGFKFYSNLVNSQVVPTQQIIKDRGFDTMFKNQQVAMFMGGAADGLETKVNNFKCVVTEVPAGPTGTKAVFADVLGTGINAKTKNPDAAFEALVDLTAAIHEWKVMPPRKSVATLENMNKLHPDRTQAMQVIINSLSYGKQYRYFENYPDWDNIFWTQLMDPIVNAKGDPEKLIPTVKPLLDEKLRLK